ncbi:hypothetical protein EYF80_044860 [Liparis tanakae]|uniref:Uncharacterized protein n=1 Tax=Liparis tanakae TaxID=230148 RepID=A0A4Z2FVM0_9TELE|nr:hypothetical protein EYF80_044860 [Liparis tanakae]
MIRCRSCCVRMSGRSSRRMTLEGSRPCCRKPSRWCCRWLTFRGSPFSSSTTRLTRPRSPRRPSASSRASSEDSSPWKNTFRMAVGQGALQAVLGEPGLQAQAGRVPPRQPQVPVLEVQLLQQLPGARQHALQAGEDVPLLRHRHQLLPQPLDVPLGLRAADAEHRGQDLQPVVQQVLQLRLPAPQVPVGDAVEEEVGAGGAQVEALLQRLVHLQRPAPQGQDVALLLQADLPVDVQPLLLQLRLPAQVEEVPHVGVEVLGRVGPKVHGEDVERAGRQQEGVDELVLWLPRQIEHQEGEAALGVRHPVRDLHAFVPRGAPEVPLQARHAPPQQRFPGIGRPHQDQFEARLHGELHLRQLLLVGRDVGDALHADLVGRLDQGVVLHLPDVHFGQIPKVIWEDGDLVPLENQLLQPVQLHDGVGQVGQLPQAAHVLRELRQLVPAQVDLLQPRDAQDHLGEVLKLVGGQVEHLEPLHAAERRGQRRQLVAVQHQALQVQQEAEGVGQRGQVEAAEPQDLDGAQLHHLRRQRLKLVAGAVQLLQLAEGQDLGGEAVQLVVIHVQGPQLGEAGEGGGEEVQLVEAEVQLLQGLQRSDLSRQTLDLVSFFSAGSRPSSSGRPRRPLWLMSSSTSRTSSNTTRGTEENLFLRSTRTRRLLRLEPSPSGSSCRELLPRLSASTSAMSSGRTMRLSSELSVSWRRSRRSFLERRAASLHSRAAFSSFSLSSMARPPDPASSSSSSLLSWRVFMGTARAAWWTGSFTNQRARRGGDKRRETEAWGREREQRLRPRRHPLRLRTQTRSQPRVRCPKRGAAPRGQCVLHGPHRSARRLWSSVSSRWVSSRWVSFLERSAPPPGAPPPQVLGPQTANSTRCCGRSVSGSAALKEKVSLCAVGYESFTYWQLTSRWLRQPSDVSRSFTAFWKDMFLTFTVPARARSFSTQCSRHTEFLSRLWRKCR